MASVVNIFTYIFPVLMVSIAAVLLCFYFYSKMKSSSYDVTAPTCHAASAIDTVSSPDNQSEVDWQYDRLPPRYSTVDHPPPYSLFDPKLTNIWPGGPPPAYEMYPITLPLAPHYWRSQAEPL